MPVAYMLPEESQLENHLRNWSWGRARLDGQRPASGDYTCSRGKGSTISVRAQRTRDSPTGRAPGDEPGLHPRC